MRPLVTFTRNTRRTARYSRQPRCCEGGLIHNLWKGPRTTEKSVCWHGRHGRCSAISTGISPVACSSQIYGRWFGVAKRTFPAPLWAHSGAPPTPLCTGGASHCVLRPGFYHLCLLSTFAWTLSSWL